MAGLQRHLQPISKHERAPESSSNHARCEPENAQGFLQARVDAAWLSEVRTMSRGPIGLPVPAIAKVLSSPWVVRRL